MRQLFWDALPYAEIRDIFNRWLCEVFVYAIGGSEY